MAKLEGADKVIAALKVREKQIVKKCSVAIGYSTRYALYVHERVEMKWRGLPRHPPAKGEYWGPRGQAKFLEEPFRRMASDLATIIRTAVIKGSTLPQALLIAGLRLQRESQKLVPVDTGVLKNSAFTKLDKIA